MRSLSKLEIIQGVREFHPGGGVSGVAFALDAAFRKRGFAVRNFTIDDLGINKRTPKSMHRYLAKAKQLFDVVYFSVAGGLVARRRFDRDATICHNDMLFGAVYVNHGLHRAMLDASGRKWQMLLRNPIHPFLVLRDWCRFNLDVHRWHVCFSQSEADQLIRYYPRTQGKIRIIPNGVDADRFSPDAAARREIRGAEGLSDDQFVLVFVGHEYERKGLYALIESLVHLPTSVRLLVVGGSPQEISKGEAVGLRLGVRDRISFMGIRSQVERVINAADALVLPSLFESWGLVGLEAMGCGIPALMTNTGGVTQYLQEGVNGYLVTHDAQDIARQVRRLQSDPAQYQAMQRQARVTAQRYSWDVIAGQYIDLLQSQSTATTGARTA